MVLAAHAEDEVSAGEADLDGDRPRAHLGKQAFHVAFEGKRDAMADAAGARDLDGRADVKGKVGRRNEAEPQLARVQRHRHVAGEKTDDLHVADVVAARYQIVFGPDEIERDRPRFRADQRGRNGGLDEHLVRGIVAIDLDDVAEGDTAARLRVAGIACQCGPYLADRGGQGTAPCRYAIAEPARFQRLELGGIVGRLADCLDEPVAIASTRRRHHELDVLYVLAVVTPELLDRHVDEMRAGYFAEFLEGREEFVVAGRHGGRWQERAH